METRRQTDSFPTFMLFYYKSCRFVVEKFEGTYKNREAKGKGEKERYTHLNAEFQRIARRDKKGFLSDQCKQIKENNNMGMTIDTMAPHSGTLAWKIPWMEEPVRLQSMGSLGVGHN